MPRQRLISPTGVPIVAQLDRIESVKVLITEIFRDEKGELDIDWQGESRVDWDTQTPHGNEAGKRIYIDANGTQWTEDELVPDPDWKPEPDPDTPTGGAVDPAEIDRFD